MMEQTVGEERWSPALHGCHVVFHFSLSWSNLHPGRTHCSSSVRKQRAEDVQKEMANAFLIASESRMSLHRRPFRMTVVTLPPLSQSRVGGVTGNKDSGFADVNATGFKLFLATSVT